MFLTAPHVSDLPAPPSLPPPVCPLQVKLLESGAVHTGTIGSFLGKAVEPPMQQAVDNALAELKDIGALEEDEALTQLGRHLAAFALPPRMSKLLLFGVLFGCLDPALTVACGAAYRDPWVLPMDR